MRLIPIPESRPTNVTTDDRTDRSLVHKADSAPTDPGLETKPDSAFIIAGNPDSKSSTPEFVTTRVGQIKLKRIPAGTFRMGSAADDNDARPNEKPQHQVRITKPFYLGIYEVTQAQYESVIGSNPSYFSPTGDGKDKVAGRSTSEYPVERVSWKDAVKFCNALSRKESLKPFYEENGENVAILDRRGSGYRLPTEAEWEYACRAGSAARYSFGNAPALLLEHGWIEANSGGVSHPVGEKRPNGFGIYDMHGNVCEWCSDLWDAGYYKKSPEVDPPGPLVAPFRLTRGGTWQNSGLAARSAFRNEGRPGVKASNRGFRLARNVGSEFRGLPQVAAASSNTNPTITVDNKGGKADPARRVANETTPPQVAAAPARRS